MSMGQIVATVRNVEIGNRWERVVDSVRWEGPGMAVVNARLLGSKTGDHGIGDFIELGPYVMRIVDFAHAEGGWLVVRCDVAGDAVAFLWPLWVACQIFWLRLIHTAAIWGLASIPPGEQAHWRQIHVLRWLAERSGR